MRIHSDVLTIEHINAAADQVPGVHIHSFSKHGSRRRHHAIEVFLSGNSKHGGQYGNTNGIKTASWDDWGMVLARLYIIDPLLSTRQYPDLEEFRQYTLDRFIGETQEGYGAPWVLTVTDPDPVHHIHRWQHMGTSDTGGGWFSCEGSKAIDCTAELDVPRGGRR